MRAAARNSTSMLCPVCINFRSIRRRESDLCRGPRIILQRYMQRSASVSIKKLVFVSRSVTKRRRVFSSDSLTTINDRMMCFPTASRAVCIVEPLIRIANDTSTSHLLADHSFPSAPATANARTTANANVRDPCHETGDLSLIASIDCRMVISCSVISCCIANRSYANLISNFVSRKPGSSALCAGGTGYRAVSTT